MTSNIFNSLDVLWVLLSLLYFRRPLANRTFDRAQAWQGPSSLGIGGSTIYKRIDPSISFFENTNTDVGFRADKSPKYKLYQLCIRAIKLCLPIGYSKITDFVRYILCFLERHKSTCVHLVDLHDNKHKFTVLNKQKNQNIEDFMQHEPRK